MRIKDYDFLIRDVNIMDELDKRGIKGTPTGNNIMFCCPFHGETTPSFWLKTSEGERKGLYKCFSCLTRGTFFDLLAFLDDIPLDEVLKKYRKEEVTAKDISEFEVEFRRSLSSSAKKGSKIRILDEKILERFKKPYGAYEDYLFGPKRNLTGRTIERFGLLACDSGVWAGRVVVPMRDDRGRLISLNARAIGKVDKSEKVRKLKDTDVKKILFGLNLAKKMIGPFVLVEGEFDCAFLQQNGIKAVALSGADINDEQIKLLLKYSNSNRIVICLDGDVPYYKDKKRPRFSLNIKDMKDRLAKYFLVEVVSLPNGKDPDELDDGELEYYFRDYKSKIA